jgi:two-component system sensor histidine kinase PilS (NtrC family)
VSVASGGTTGAGVGGALLPATDTLWTLLRYFAVGRVILAALLLLLVTLDTLSSLLDRLGNRPLFAAAALAYLLLSLGFAASASFWRRAFETQFAGQVLTDLVLLTLLMHAAGGPGSGIGVLLVAAVGGAAVLSTPLMAAFFAATATLLILGESTWRAFGTAPMDTASFVPAALVSGACFVTAALVNRLAVRLAAQEALARQRGADLRSQLAITQLVIAELPQGVVVLDAQGQVRTMNRSAQQILGATGPWPVIEQLARLHSRLERETRNGRAASAGSAGALRSAAGPGTAARTADEPDSIPATGTARPDADSVELSLDPASGNAAAGAGGHRVRVRFLRPQSTAQSDIVLVIEDQEEIEERARQLKLASMGRLSASIAHEIRNPLAAIRYANGLLAEQVAMPAQQRLARIIEDNSVRIDRIVEDVLSIARRERPTLERIDVARFLETLVAEFVTLSGAPRARIEVIVDTDEVLEFDARHLRLVLVNLMTNALRYATNADGALRLHWRRAQGDRLEFRVADDGPGLPAEMLEHVFEPFFTTEARGTGLGLYLAREFCVANQAALRYERSAPGERHGSAFVIVPRSAEAQ